VGASLIDSFFKYCSPWTPIVDESLVEDIQSNGSSPLLLNAIFLAGSRVSSNSLVAATAEDFYRKAKLLFMLGHERDILRSIMAVTLLQWFNPLGPEHISTSTSGFWVRIAAGLAYQVGLHKEPNGQQDRGLRRRMWWTLVVCCLNPCSTSKIDRGTYSAVTISFPWVPDDRELSTFATATSHPFLCRIFQLKIVMPMAVCLCPSRVSYGCWRI
jgi:hypothetical protein